MNDVIVQLPLDRTGRSPNNLIGSEEHPLVVTQGFPYKIITLEHGGFYVKGLRVYDAQYNKLDPNTDYIVTYVYKNASESTGLDICGAIVFLDPQRTGKVFVSAQMVGGDLCYSFTVIEDYVKFFNTKPAGYVPTWMDYVGNEPLWKPGELEKERWHLDTYQPFNNEIEKIAVTVEGGDGTEEDNVRAKIDTDYREFMARFNDRLDRHIADKSNPHVDTKNNRLIALSQLENYAVATEAEAVVGESNALYMTPYLTSLSLDEWALKPLNQHINNKNNPHRVTIDQTGSTSYKTVLDLADTKYERNEQVANANYASWNDQLWTYDQLYINFRKDIPAQNFSAKTDLGLNYLNPSRIGRSPSGTKKVLMSNGIWTDFNALTATYVTSSAPTILIIQNVANMSQAQANAQISLHPQAWTAPVGSLAYYTLTYQVWWGMGNGASLLTFYPVYGSIKTDSGWIPF